ncbi:MAG: Mrp/NBP35 family ATP-binding protein [Paracoccaceae bacterium]
MPITKDEILNALRQIEDPISKKNIVAADLVRALNIEGTEVRFVMEVAPEHGAAMEVVRAKAVSVLESLHGVEKANVLLTAHTAPKAPPNLGGAKRRAPAGPVKIPGIDKILVVASGKGGVGKSTVASNLAVALAQAGKRIGLLDADIYGPSQPQMLGLSGHPKSPDGKTIIPMKNHGVTAMSIGLMMKEGEAVIWRGPMLSGALQQMLNQVEWGALDVLIIDLPPGTGDVQLSLSQKAEITGAIVVSTPQDVALLDARKALDMFRKTKTPVLGMIENMSTHICTNCGHEEHIFGHGGTRSEAEKLALPFLGEVPLDISIRVAGDVGTPIVAGDPGGKQAKAFRDIAQNLIDSGVV